MFNRSQRSALLAAAALLIPACAFAANPFPAGPQDDIAPSMGVFRIIVDPPYRAWFNTNLTGNPSFWDGTRLTSPVLYDRFTTIGRSAPHTQSSLADVNGTPVGTAGTIINDVMMNFPPGFNFPNTSRFEVHTEVRSLNLMPGPGCGPTVCGGAVLPLSVMAGSGNGLPICPGEVESNINPKINGFPAKSFFDVFVEVNLGGGLGFGVVKNGPTQPLIVTHDAINGFPPQVVYIHENTSAVPVYFKNSGTTGAAPFTNYTAGDRFGYLVLAGHAANLACSDSATISCAQLFNQVTNMPEMPLPPPGPAIGGWWLLALLMALLLSGLWVIQRRRSAAA
jgi:hypothetical protein